VKGESGGEGRGSGDVEEEGGRGGWEGWKQRKIVSWFLRAINQELIP